MKKEEIKQFLVIDDIILYTENAEKFTKKLTQLIKDLSKIIGYKINIKNELYFYRFAMSRLKWIDVNNSIKKHQSIHLQGNNRKRN